MSRKKIYTEEELKERRRERQRIYARKKYYEKKNDAEFKEIIKERSRKYYQKYKAEITEKHNKYDKTPMGRAHHLLCAYNQSDKLNDRGKGDLSSRWIVENIFTKPCAHCGETDWTKLGCNRLDNSKPHTMDNVEPCCMKCNLKVSSGRPHKATT